MANQSEKYENVLFDGSLTVNCRKITKRVAELGFAIF
jgi:hypothetical protein